MMNLESRDVIEHVPKLPYRKVKRSAFGFGFDYLI